MGIRVPFAVSRFARKAHHFGLNGERGRRSNLSRVYFWSVSLPQITLGILARKPAGATLALLFQGGVEFPTGGKSGGAKGAPWRRQSACDRADESATRVCVGSHAG